MDARVLRALALAFAILTYPGCKDREIAHEPYVQSERTQPKKTQASKPPKKVAAGDFRYPAAERLVAIGDLHGDLSAARAALRLAGAIDDADHWVGGKLTVVQTGDQLDRGDHDREIVDLFDALTAEAHTAGGRVVALSGNHETMNVQGDFRYVTEGGLAFGPVDPVSPWADRVPLALRERAGAFLPGGQYARLLAKRPVVAVVGDSAFAHGGILPEHVAQGLSKINHEVSAWMRDGAAGPPAAVSSQNAPVWTRVYGNEGTPQVCRLAERVLAELGVRRMVVGHTVQKGGITSICDHKVWRIDVGLSAYYGNAPISVLEISDGHARPVSRPR